MTTTAQGEQPPTTEQLELIDAVEADPEALGMDLASWACWLQGQLPGHRHGYAPSLPALEPTAAEPGSAEKVRVLRQRARAGQSLSHPRDARLPESPHEPGDEEAPRGRDA